MNTKRRLLLGALSALALMIPAAAANAAILDKSSYADSDSGTFEDCGTTWSFDFQVSGMAIVRLDDDGETVLVQDNSSFTDTLTNLETGRSVSIAGHSLYREYEAARVGDMLTLWVRHSGVPVVITDDTGQVLLRDRGLIVFRQTLRVTEDGVEFLDEQVLADHGGHPEYYSDFCSVFLPATS
jgi:hypothetical protein